MSARKGLSLADTDAIRKALGLPEDADGAAIVGAAEKHAAELKTARIMLGAAAFAGVTWEPSKEMGFIALSAPAGDINKIRKLMGRHCRPHETLLDAVRGLVQNYEETSEILGEHKAGIASAALPPGWRAGAHSDSLNATVITEGGTWTWSIGDNGVSGRGMPTRDLAIASVEAVARLLEAK